MSTSSSASRVDVDASLLKPTGKNLVDYSSDTEVCKEKVTALKKPARMKSAAVDSESSPSDAVYGECTPVSRYEKINKIGSGTYGTVYRAKSVFTLSEYFFCL